MQAVTDEKAVSIVFPSATEIIKNDPKKMKTTVTAGLCAGCALFAASWLQQLGIQLTDSAGKAGFITGLYMIIALVLFWLETVIYGWIVKKIRQSRTLD